MTRLLLALLVFSSLLVYSQDSSVLNNKREFRQIAGQIEIYNQRMQKLWNENNQTGYEACRDSLKAIITNSYIDNYTFKDINNKNYSTQSKKRPLFLQVTASWCKPCRFEVTALNRIVEKYHDKVDFVLLFWDTQPGLLKIAKEYDQRIYLVPSLKEQNESGGLEISGFKHTLGFPCNYLVTLNNGLAGFSQGAMMPVDMIDDHGKAIKVTAEEADQGNYKRLESEIIELINQ